MPSVRHAALESRLRPSIQERGGFRAYRTSEVLWTGTHGSSWLRTAVTVPAARAVDFRLPIDSSSLRECPHRSVNASAFFAEIERREAFAGNVRKEQSALNRIPKRGCQNLERIDRADSAANRSFGIEIRDPIGTQPADKRKLRYGDAKSRRLQTVKGAWIDPEQLQNKLSCRLRNKMTKPSTGEEKTLRGRSRR